MPKALVAVYLSGFSLAAASIATAGPALAAAPHDGVWSVSMVTTSGDCSPSVSSRIEVRGGRVDMSYLMARIVGVINPKGLVALSVIGPDNMTARGKVAGVRGSGKWNSTTRHCSGVWTATRA